MWRKKGVGLALLAHVVFPVKFRLPVGIMGPKKNWSQPAGVVRIWARCGTDMAYVLRSGGYSTCITCSQ